MEAIIVRGEPLEIASLILEMRRYKPEWDIALRLKVPTGELWEMKAWLEMCKKAPHGADTPNGARGGTV